MALSPSCDMLMLDEENELRNSISEEILSAHESGDEDDACVDDNGDGWGKDTHLLSHCKVEWLLFER